MVYRDKRTWEVAAKMLGWNIVTIKSCTAYIFAMDSRNSWGARDLELSTGVLFTKYEDWVTEWRTKGYNKRVYYTQKE